MESSVSFHCWKIPLIPSDSKQPPPCKVPYAPWESSHLNRRNKTRLNMKSATVPEQLSGFSLPSHYFYHSNYIIKARQNVCLLTNYILKELTLIRQDIKFLRNNDESGCSACNLLTDFSFPFSSSLYYWLNVCFLNKIPLMGIRYFIFSLLPCSKTTCDLC